MCVYACLCLCVCVCVCVCVCGQSTANSVYTPALLPYPFLYFCSQQYKHIVMLVEKFISKVSSIL